MLFFVEPVVLGEGAGHTAQALVELAASGLDKEQRFEALTRSYAEVRASRRALDRNERLRSLGEMSAGIAHDLKNLLDPLSLYVSLESEPGKGTRFTLGFPLAEPGGG